MRTIKVRHDLPFMRRQTLLNKYGYHVQKESFKEFVVFAKGEVKKEQLSLHQEAELTKRCDNIALSFTDPYANVGPLRARIVGMMARMSDAEKEFVQEYMDENFPITVKLPTVVTPPGSPLLLGLKPSLDKRKELADRCDRTINFFAEPDNCVQAIRTRIHNFMQGLDTQERDYVAGYMAVKFPQAGIA